MTSWKWHHDENSTWIFTFTSSLTHSDPKMRIRSNQTRNQHTALWLVEQPSTSQVHWPMRSHGRGYELCPTLCRGVSDITLSIWRVRQLSTNTSCKEPCDLGDQWERLWIAYLIACYVTGRMDSSAFKESTAGNSACWWTRSSTAGTKVLLQLNVTEEAIACTCVPKKWSERNHHWRYTLCFSFNTLFIVYDVTSCEQQNHWNNH